MRRAHTEFVLACHCRFATSAPRHHDELLHAGADLAAAVDLVELAVTWDELEYSAEPLIPPTDWLEFWSDHAWPDPNLAYRLLSVAVDASRATRAAGSAPRRSTALRPA